MSTQTENKGLMFRGRPVEELAQSELLTTVYWLYSEVERLHDEYIRALEAQIEIADPIWGYPSNQPCKR